MRFAVSCVELLPTDAFLRIFGMEIEGKPVDLGAVPTLQPRGPLVTDVAKGSQVVTPDHNRVFSHWDTG